jgi:octaprenyl-diphosphate synthase
LNRSVDSPPPDLVRLFEPIRDDLVRVEREFGRHLQSQVALIPKIGKYIQQSGGKRVRPAVLLMAARLCGYQGEKAVLHAAVVEFIHTATLVHDDIIDFLYIKSMSLALSQDSLDMVRLLCDVTLRMIEGELYQLTKNGDIDITEDEHFDIIRRKTAYLFAGCAQIGGMLGNATLDQQGALRDYGFNLGIAFQVMDDLLDFTGDTTALGKPVGGDLREGKVTLPIIRLLAQSDQATRKLVAEVVEEKNVTIERWAEITRLLRQSGALDYAMTRANDYALAARQKLSAFPPGPERDALAALADYVLLRDR